MGYLEVAHTMEQTFGTGEGRVSEETKITRRRRLRRGTQSMEAARLFCFGFFEGLLDGLLG
jgi:hypothetical protein